MRPVFMDVYPLDVFAVYIAAGVSAPLENEAGKAPLCRLVREHRARKTAAHNQIIMHKPYPVKIHLYISLKVLYYNVPAKATGRRLTERRVFCYNFSSCYRT